MGSDEMSNLSDRTADRLLQRIRMLVRESRSDNGANGVELEEREREIERLKEQLAEVVKRTAANDGELR